MLLPHLLPMFAGWAVTALALWIEHVLLLHQPWRLRPPATYRVGVLTILAGYCLWAGLEALQTSTIEPWLAVAALVVIGPGAGAIVELLYWWDERHARQEATRRTHELAADAEGLIDGLRGSNDPRRHN